MILRRAIALKNWLAVAALIAGARVIRLMKRRTGHGAAALLIPPVHFAGSLGDQAMLIAAIDTLAESGRKPISVITESSAKDWHLGPDILIERLGIPGKHEFMDLRIWRFLRLCLSYNECYVFGADIVDGGHGDWGHHNVLFADLAARAGLRSTILGCSINSNPSPRAKTWWNSLSPLVRVCARDPVSAKRLKSLAAHDVVQVADAAFLLRPCNDSPLVKSYAQWANEQIASNHMIVGFNLSIFFLRELQRYNPAFSGMDAYVAWTARIIERLVAAIPNVSLTLIPHDTRGGSESDPSLNERLRAQLAPSTTVPLYTIPATASAAEIKAIAAIPTMILTARMHLAIAALGQGTPCFCLGYQGKFEGLARFFELCDYCLGAKDAGELSEEEIVKRIVHALKAAPELRRRIAGKNEDIVRLAKKNFGD